MQNAIIGEDNSLLGGLIGATVLVGVNSLIVRLVRRSDRATRVFEGTPTTLVRYGEFDRPELRRLGLREEDVVQAIRHQGANDIEEVEVAVIEPAVRSWSRSCQTRRTPPKPTCAGSRRSSMR